jgi:hypothetical protein
MGQNGKATSAGNWLGTTHRVVAVFSVLNRHGALGRSTTRGLGCVLFCCILVTTALAGTPSDITAFFKRAICSPPEVEDFTATLRTMPESVPAGLLPKNARIVSPALQSFAGAIADSDFYLEYKTLPSMLIAGRLDSKAYNVVSNAVYFGAEKFDVKDPQSSDRISQACDSAFQLISQFLHMGLGDIDPHTVAWKGNEFVARNWRGTSEHASLDLSNGLPWKLTFRWQDRAPPFKTLSYVYPNPRDSLSGFPAAITISTLSNGELRPFLEITFSSVRLADHPLPKEFFSPSRFITANTVYTNVFSHDKFTSISPKGTVTVPMTAIVGDKRITWRRAVIVGSLVLLAVFPFTLFWRMRKCNNTNQQKDKS